MQANPEEEVMEKTVWASVPTGTPCVVFNEGGTAVLRTYVGMVLGRPHFDDGVWENATPVMDALNSVSRDYMDTCKSLQAALAYNEQLEAKLSSRLELMPDDVVVNRNYLADLEETVIDSVEELQRGFVLCENCGEQETATLDVMSMHLLPMKERIDATRLQPQPPAALPPDLVPLDPLDPFPNGPGTCSLCGHSLEGNSHGPDQADFDLHEDGETLAYAGSCTYCKTCQGGSR